eukprot:COSAG06_NODE_2245_length_7263_cov_19.964964_9_plen_151_part_00
MREGEAAARPLDAPRVFGGVNGGRDSTCVPAAAFCFCFRLYFCCVFSCAFDLSALPPPPPPPRFPWAPPHAATGGCVVPAEQHASKQKKLFAKNNNIEKLFAKKPHFISEMTNSNLWIHSLGSKLLCSTACSMRARAPGSVLPRNVACSA